MKSTTYKTALSIAGFDPSAGAGIFADLKVFAAYGIFCEGCVTGTTIQSTRGVRESKAEDSGWVERTLAELSLDNSFDVIKIGAAFSGDTVAVIADFLRANPRVPAVFDPVLGSSSGTSFADSNTIVRLRTELLPLCTWITPNWNELSILSKMPVASRADAELAAQQLQASCSGSTVLATGGDQQSPDDLLLIPGTLPQWISGERVETSATHGTGCTLSSALAARIALFPDESPAERVAACKRYVEGAMRYAPSIGLGPGPLNHFWERAFSASGERTVIRRAPDVFSAGSGAISKNRRMYARGSSAQDISRK